jgi:hypothetical protein
MPQKNLNNYFNDWFHVRVKLKPLVHRGDMDAWCRNISIEGVDWVKHFGDPVYRFRNEGDALLFLLKFGGEFYTPEDETNES